MAGQFKYPPEVMERCVRAVMNRGTRSVREVSAEVGVPPSVLYAWAKAKLGTARRVYGDPALANLGEQEPSHNGYAAHWVRTPEEESAEPYEIAVLREQRDKLKSEAETLRKTVVLLGKK